MQISGTVLGGDAFKFSLGSQSLTLTQGAVATTFAATLGEGSAYTVSRTDGPRACTLSASRTATIAHADVTVTADCGRPRGSSAVGGNLHAAVGTQVTLQLNGNVDRALTMPPFSGSTDPYGLLPFAFAGNLTDGAAYQVAVTTPPAEQTCTVYKGASGALPLAVGALRVGCEFTFDRLARSTDNSVRGRFFDSSAAVISGASLDIGATASGYGEGRFVAFVSSTVGLDGATGARRQVFWRDRLSGETLLFSASAAGAEGNGDSFAPAIAADGLTVVFESHASNLGAADTDAVRDVYLWSALNRAALQRVSVGPDGLQGNGKSYEPTVSGDGRMVAFSSGASNLTGGVSGNSTINVVRRDMVALTNTLRTAAAGNRAGVGGGRPALSEDGQRLAFWSFSSQLVAGDTNGAQDVFVVDLDGNLRVRRASLAADGSGGNGDSPIGQGEAIALSADGDWLAFTTGASNLGVPATNALLHRMSTGENRAVTTASKGIGPVQMSRQAAYVAHGAGSTQDPRCAGSGLFAYFTGLARAWWWFD